MLLALTPAGTRIEATPGAQAHCPQCGTEVLAKCGSLVAWHWAHRARECDTWSEGESAWHVGWKRTVRADACEVVIGNHRADIRTESGLVIELQHSAIDQQKIAEREAFYQNLIWLFDARAYQLAFYPRAARMDFEWARPHKALLAVRKPMYWDLGWGFVLLVDKLSSESPLGGFRGSGVLLDSACFASALCGGSARAELHLAAKARAGRVAACVELAITLLRARPSLGIDEALAAAMREVATPPGIER